MSSLAARLAAQAIGSWRRVLKEAEPLWRSTRLTGGYVGADPGIIV